MNINLERTKLELNGLKKMPPNLIFSDRTHHGFFSMDSTKINLKSVHDSQLSLDYYVFYGLVGDQNKLISHSTSDKIYIQNEKFDFPFWIKVVFGNDSVFSEQLYYKYRGNLLKGTDFEFESEKIDEFLKSTSIEFCIH